MARKRSPKLTAAKRKKLRSTQFALPKQRKYPIDTRGRAANAKARARQQMNKGKMTPGTFHLIVARADKRLKRK